MAPFLQAFTPSGVGKRPCNSGEIGEKGLWEMGSAIKIFFVDLLIAILINLPQNQGLEAFPANKPNSRILNLWKE
jgi:hypothetical protein